MTQAIDSMRIFVFGASGHAKVVIDAVERQGRFRIDFLVDDNPALKGEDFYGYPVIGGRDALLAAGESRPRAGIVAIGDNAARAKVAAWLRQNDFSLVSAIHPSAQISRGARIGDGTVVFACAAVNADAVIGDNAIINTGAIVEHDCVIGATAHVAPGCRLCGNVKIGNGSLIGAGTSVIPGISVGDGVVVGAGATVTHDIADGEKVAGSPARRC